MAQTYTSSDCRSMYVFLAGVPSNLPHTQHRVKLNPKTACMQCVCLAEVTKNAAERAIEATENRCPKSCIVLYTVFSLRAVYTFFFACRVRSFSIYRVYHLQSEKRRQRTIYSVYTPDALACIYSVYTPDVLACIVPLPLRATAATSTD